MATVRVAGLGVVAEAVPTPAVRVAGLGVVAELRIVPTTAVNIVFDGVGLLAYADRASLEATISSFEATSMTDAAAVQLPTVTRWAFPFGGPWSPEIDARLGPVAVRGGRGPLAVRFGYIQYTWSDAQLVDYRITSEAKGAGIVWLATVAGSGKPTRGDAWLA